MSSTTNDDMNIHSSSHTSNNNNNNHSISSFQSNTISYSPPLPPCSSSSLFNKYQQLEQIVPEKSVPLSCSSSLHNSPTLRGFTRSTNPSTINNTEHTSINNTNINTTSTTTSNNNNNNTIKEAHKIVKYIASTHNSNNNLNHHHQQQFLSINSKIRSPCKYSSINNNNNINHRSQSTQLNNVQSRLGRNIYPTSSSMAYQDSESMILSQSSLLTTSLSSCCLSNDLKMLDIDANSCSSNNNVNDSVAVSPRDSPRSRMSLSPPSTPQKYIIPKNRDCPGAPKKKVGQTQIRLGHSIPRVLFPSDIVANDSVSPVTDVSLSTSLQLLPILDNSDLLSHL